MKRYTPIAALALTVGVGIGLAVAFLSGSSESVNPPQSIVDQPSARIENTVLVPETTLEPSALTAALTVQPSTALGEPAIDKAHVATETSIVPEVTDPLTIAGLKAQLLQEQAARRQLENQLSEFQAALKTLEQRLTRLASRSENAGQSAQAAAAGSGGIDPAKLMAAGFSAPEAADLAQRWGQQQMDLLYLRDQAIREGWLDTPEYNDAVRDLRSSTSSLQEDLGKDGYDRFLYATGHPNRVAVSSVFESSPGQIAGLQPGDIISSYDGAPIRSGNDLRNATSGGAPDEPVPMQVIRNGQPIELSLPRGPIGIQMEPVSVAPN